MIDYYSLLGVPRNADEDEIKKAYRKLMKSGAHPDLGGDAERAKDINAAYRTLLDPVRRARYDRELYSHEITVYRRRQTSAAEAVQDGITILKTLFREATGATVPRSRPAPEFRVVRCLSCEMANRVPHSRGISQARCGSCGTPLVGTPGPRDEAIEKLKEGLNAKRSGDLTRALGRFHESIQACPQLQNGYLEIAAIYMAWEIPHQARLYHDLAEENGRYCLDPDILESLN